LSCIVFDFRFEQADFRRVATARLKRGEMKSLLKPFCWRGIGVRWRCFDFHLQLTAYQFHVLVTWGLRSRNEHSTGKLFSS